MHMQFDVKRLLSKGHQDHDEETHRDSWPELVGAQRLDCQLESWHGINLGPLHLGDSCVV